jgi:4-coumarate--CoA ligase
MFYASIAANGTFSAISAASTPKELARLIQSAPSELIICDKETKTLALEAAKICGIPTSRVLEIDASGPGALLRVDNGRDVLGSEMLEWERITDRETLRSRIIALIYSSGTTGLPKGVPLSHRNMVSAAVIANECFKECFKIHPFRTLAHLPTAHIAGLSGYLSIPFYMGGPTYWMPRFDFPLFLEYNRRHKITFFFTVPPIYLLIAKSSAVKDHFDNLVIAISGAAPLGKDLQQAASAKLGKGKTFISQTWGLSENTGSATFLAYPEKDDTGSVARLTPTTSARIIDDDGRDVKVGQPGELLLKGPIVFRGYHGNHAANKEAFVDDGWFCTGDIGFFKDGLFYIVDRKKELIKYKGLQVAPAELEGLLLSHEKILDAAVIGVYDEEQHTEVPRAYVVANRNQISAEEISRFVKEHVASHKQLRGGVVFAEAIPKSASGKILRKDLRELSRKEKAAKPKL